MRTGTDVPVVTVREWEARSLPGIELTDDDRTLLARLAAERRDPHFSVLELRDGLRLQTGSHVGVIRLSGCEIRIVPKLVGGGAGLVSLIEFTCGLEALRRAQAERTILAAGNDLFDLTALLFAEACEGLVRRGLFSDYLNREDALPVVRGRLLLDRQLLERFGLMDRIICRFDEREYGIPENQLLAVALNLCRRHVSHPAVKRKIGPLAALFDALVEEVPDVQDMQREPIDYHRLNEHYRQPHELAHLVLGSLGLDDVFASGSTRSFAFLIDMNDLFERFVARLCSKVLPAAAFRVRLQHADSTIVWDARLRRPYSRVIPDVVIEPAGDRSRPIPLDAKYKLYDERKLDSSDVYQTFLYSFAYGGRAGRPVSLLVYPSTSGHGQTQRLQVRRDGEPQAEIWAFACDVNGTLQEMASGVAGPLAAAFLDTLREAATSVSGGIGAHSLRHDAA